jgi:hypothetical protein
MRTKSVLILASVAAMLIVAGTGNAFATNGWASQSDVSILSNSGATYYTSISGTGEFAVNSQISWNNAFNHQSSSAGQRYPEVYWAYNNGGTLSYMKSTPFSYTDVWSAITSGHGQSSTGSYYIGVVHKYWDVSKLTNIATSMINQPYNVV